MPDNIETRLERLEQVHSDGYRLADSVDRLGYNASALQEALLQVDRNQQALTRLGGQLDEVVRVTATKGELVSTSREQEEKAKEFRKAALQRTYLIALLLLTAIAVVVAVTTEVLKHRQANEIRVCNQRNQQTELIVEILRGSDSARKYVDDFQALVIDCEREFR